MIGKSGGGTRSLKEESMIELTDGGNDEDSEKTMAVFEIESIQIRKRYCERQSERGASKKMR